MKKSTLFMILALVLSMAIGLTGTLAYLTDTDEDVNVMTLGNVDIEQIELERIEQSDDNTDDTNLQDFSQGKPLYPAVGPIDWADENQKWPTGGSSQMFTDDLENVVDKFVFVENTGKSDAYVRTVFAFEAGTLSQAEWHEMIHLSTNSHHWQWNPEDVGSSEDHAVIIDGCKYYLAEAIYLGNAGTDHDVHKDGILAPGETTRPSLLQVFLDSKATNETMEALDGNGNGTYDILVVSQAVQAMGFDDAETALDEAFGEIDADNNPWKENGEDLDDTPVIPMTVSTAEELTEALESLDANIILANDIELDEEWTPIGSKENGEFFTGVLDGNGHTISGLNISNAPEEYAALICAMDGGVVKNLTVEGSVTAKNAAGIVARMDSGLIENCVNNATINGTSKAGGIACLTNVDGAVIRNCVNNGDITGDTTGGSGGIVGYANATTVIEDCENTGKVGSSSAKYAGGMVGYATSNPNSENHGSEINGCKNSGAIEGNNSGGIAGMTTGTKWSITDCENTSTSITGGCPGAILGNENGTSPVTNCTNTATGLKEIGNK